MKIGFSHVALLFFTLLFPVVQCSAQQESVFNKFAGTYVTGHEFGGGSIKLEANGTFSSGGGSDDGTEISETGKYSFSDRILHFVFTKRTVKRRDEKEVNLLDPDESKANGFSSGGIEKEFSLLPVQWSGRIYLIYEKDLKNFANAINLGLEPRSRLISNRLFSPWYGSFYLRSGDEKKKVGGKPNLPKEWLSFLLKQSLTATVIKVQEINKGEYVTLSTVTVNKGSKDGLKVGMRLLSNNEVPSQWDGSEVISVETSTAKVRARLYNAELKVGDKLRTRYELKGIYRKWAAQY